jgi:cyclopropane fatty-acyl-phospholipid synthase-like methyltransferase
MKTDVFGKAIQAYYSGHSQGQIHTYSSLDEEDHFPLSYLFRNYQDMPLLEQTALDLCTGSILDIGCGAGSHSLHLTRKGLEVTALDLSPGAAEVCRKRGLPEVVQADIWNYKGRKYDTLLLLMNGIGIVGSIDRMPDFLKKAKELLHPGGQVLFDSSDIRYMFEEDELPLPGEAYYGEVIFQVVYEELRSDPFPWLYIDYHTLKKIGEEHGFNTELVRKGDHYDYLAKLTPIGY